MSMLMKYKGGNEDSNRGASKTKEAKPGRAWECEVGEDPKLLMQKRSKGLPECAMLCEDKATPML